MKKRLNKDKMKSFFESKKRNSINLNIIGDVNYKKGLSRIGGNPDVVKGFEWPYFEGEGIDGSIESRPLSFLAQFNCEEISKYDADNILPKKGLLSFFYEKQSERWGYDVEDKGCGRVYWFENIDALEKKEFPKDLDNDYKLPMKSIEFNQEISLPALEELIDLYKFEIDDYEELMDEYEIELERENSSKLLGWPELMQNSIAPECELISKNYSLGSSDNWSQIPNKIKKEAKKNAMDKWILLFQLDSQFFDDFEFMFDDCGKLYFYIKKEDLENRNFEDVWVSLQC